MSRLEIHYGLCFRKKSLLFLGAVGLTILGSTALLHGSLAHAQGKKGGDTASAPIASKLHISGENSEVVLPAPPRDLAAPKISPQVHKIRDLIAQKQKLLDETDAQIEDRMQILSQCQNNMSALVGNVSDGGLSHIDRYIHETQPMIQHLKSQMNQTRYQVALLAVSADAIDLRIVQLKMDLTHALQPDPTRLISLQKDLEQNVNRILHGIDPADPLFNIELANVSKLRSEREANIEAEKASLMNLAALQGLAAADWQDSEHERYLRHQTTDLIGELRDELLESSAWRGEND